MSAQNEAAPEASAQTSASGAAWGATQGPKTQIGIVTSDRMRKTRAVKVARLEPHAKYGKYVKRQTTYLVHDEGEKSHVGDTVRIEETRPLSRRKRWRLLEIVAKSRYSNVAAVEQIEGAGEGGPQS